MYARRVSQKNSVDDPVVSSKQPGTAPSSGSSGSKVTLRLTFDAGIRDEAVFTVTQVEGAMIRVKRDPALTGIAPRIDTEHGNQVMAEIRKVVSVNLRDDLPFGSVALAVVAFGQVGSSSGSGAEGQRADVILRRAHRCRSLLRRFLFFLSAKSL